MDNFMKHHVGVRNGRICPCCAEAGSKEVATRHARRRFAAETRREVEVSFRDRDDDRRDNPTE